MHYLDHNATSPIRPECLSAVTHALAVGGNPSSVHTNGRAARAIVEEARTRVAALAGAPADTVIFTSGATESNNLALFGAVEGSLEGEASRITRIFVSTIEHSSVLATADRLAERFPWVRVMRLPVTADGIVGLEVTPVRCERLTDAYSVNGYLLGTKITNVEHRAPFERYLDSVSGQSIGLL